MSYQQRKLNRHVPTTPLKKDQEYRIKQFANDIIPYSESYIRILIRKDQFPAPDINKVGYVAWYAETLEKWLIDHNVAYNKS